MEITEIIDKVEDAPEHLREFYVKGTDGKFKFDPAGAVAGIKTNRDTILSEKRAITEKYKDIDLDAYNAWKQDQEKQKTQQQKDKNDWDAREASLKESHGKELQKEKDRNLSIFKALDKQLIENTTIAALTDAKVVPAKVKVLMPHIKNQLKVIEADGEFVARVVDASGKVRYQNGVEMTIAQLVGEFKSDEAFSDCFLAEQSKGSGTSSTAQSKPTGRTVQTETSTTQTLNPTERLKSVRRAATAKR